MGDLFTEPRPASPAALGLPRYYKKSPIVAGYEYRDETGALKYRILRTADKQFPQQRYENGEWIWKAPQTKLLYHLPEIIADDTDQPIFLVGGEKDADNVQALGLLATCNSGGETPGKFTQSNEALRGRLCVILPDNDETGRVHAAEVQAKLNGIASRVLTLEFPDLPEHGDVSDWIAAGGTKDLLLLAVDEGLKAPPPASLFVPSDTLTRANELSPMGLAARFHEKFYRSTRYVEPRRAFYNYRDGVWIASQCRVERKCKEIINDVHDDSARVADEIKQLQERYVNGDVTVLEQIQKQVAYLEALRKFLPKIKTPSAMTDMLAFARSDLLIDPDAFDPNHAIVNVQNGVIDLDAGKFRPHRAEDLCSMQSPLNYDPDARCERWLRFLREIFLEDQELIDFIQRAIGYTLSGFTGEQIFLILHGDGANGKSELFRVLNQLFGGYQKTAKVDTFMDEKHSNGHNEDIARLRGVRLVMTSETEKTRKLAEGLVKALTGGERITASYKHERTFEFIPRFKVWLAANHKPNITGTDWGIWRRILLVPFRATFVKSNETLKDKTFHIDPDLSAMLSDELPGILNWAIAGYRLWREHGLNPPAIVRAASEDYREESDKLGAFLSEEMLSGLTLICPLADAYQAYRTWAETGGMKPASIRGFSSDLKSRGIEVKKAGSKNAMSIVGYGLLAKD